MSTATGCREDKCQVGRSDASSSGGHYENNGDDEAVKSEGLSEDHHENERNQNILLSVGAHTSVTHNTDSEASGQGGKSTAETGGELLVAKGVVVLPLASLHNVLVIGHGLHCCNKSKSN